jgi:hypothetical protein
LKALKDRLKKPDDEDVTTQWADQNTNDNSNSKETIKLINESTSPSPAPSSSTNSAVIIETNLD